MSAKRVTGNTPRIASKTGPHLLDQEGDRQFEHCILAVSKTGEGEGSNTVMEVV